MSADSIFQQKQQIRSRIEQKRGQLSPELVESKSAKIVAELKSLPEIKKAKWVHCYVSYRNEVQTQTLINDLLKMGQRVVVPVIDSANHALLHAEIKSASELVPGAFGILEPQRNCLREVNPSELDLIIVPGVAFDLSGHRIGFGGGYYDAFLAGLAATKIALAYAFQIVDKIPIRDEDQKMDFLITEKGTCRFD